MRITDYGRPFTTILMAYLTVIIISLMAAKCITMNKTKETTINYEKNGIKEAKKP